MRTIKKRLCVINDGFCKSSKLASERIIKVVDRYVFKMSKKGWIPYCRTSSGNAFFNYEAYVRLCKPTTSEEKSEIISRALTEGWELDLEKNCLQKKK